MAIIFRSIKGTSLTHTELDNNFRSFYYSSSLQENGAVLRLHRNDIANTDFQDINLSGENTSVTILNQTNNRLTTATSNNNELNAESSLTFDGVKLTLGGTFSIADEDDNILIGSQAGASISGSAPNVVAVGEKAAKHICTGYTVAIGQCALTSAIGGYSVGIGDGALSAVEVGISNTAIGNQAGAKLTSGRNNIYIGSSAGPTANTAQDGKLYINAGASDTPLILGDFTTGQVTINSQVSASIFSGSFVGDGSGLTNLSFSTEWDGSRSGSAEVTGSFIVSGSTQVPSTVDFTATTAISGSTFSGSFVGNGAGLTGVVATGGLPYTGSAIISGSLSVETRLSITGSNNPTSPTLVVSGSFNNIYIPGFGIADQTSLPLEVKGPARLDRVLIHSPVQDLTGQSFGIGSGALATNRSGSRNYAIGVNALGTQPTNTFYRDNVAFGTETGLNATKQNVLIGNYAGKHGRFNAITAIGYKAMGLGVYNNSGSHHNNTGVGLCSQGYINSGVYNTSVGGRSLMYNIIGNENTAIGYRALFYNGAPDSNVPREAYRNTALGYGAGQTHLNGDQNVYIGYQAGPAFGSTQCKSNQFYLGISQGETPLLRGDFNTGQLTVHNQVSASAFSGSFFGNGSGLTNVEWDGSRNGNAEITGSFILSGSNVIADFTNTAAISGSIFSGSFVGNGAGLTGLPGVEWDGSRNGDSNITGSLIVSGALDVSNTLTLGSVGYPGGPGVELIHIHSGSLAGNKVIRAFAIHVNTGYTGFKADYSLTNTGEDQKKVGSLYGSWDRDGNSTINDVHALAEGAINTTVFSIDASSQTSAILKLNAQSGDYDLNMLITAFKRQV